MNGSAAGGGLAIALLHDFRIGSSAAKYTTAFMQVGVSPELGMSVLLTRLVGYRVATDLLLRGRVITGDEAAAIGLVDRVAESSQVLETAMELARELAELPPVAMQLTKRALRAAGYSSLEEQLRLEYQNQLVAFASGEPLAASEALRNRRHQAGTQK
jgi:enoyl-CoA hydratase/carnithine racemase